MKLQEVHTEAEFVHWLEGPDQEIAVRGLDLTEHTEGLLAKHVRGVLFLGCIIEDRAVCSLVDRGAFVLPTLQGFAFETHRAQLYDVETLFAGFEDGGRRYQATLDARIYAEYLEQGGAFPPSIRTTLARRLHDHSMTDAVEDLIVGRRVAAVMGGHAMERGSEFYARIAKLSRRLTRAGYLMVSGGGPGAMEATHLGAYFAGKSDDDLDGALLVLQQRPMRAEPGKEYADPDWLERAWQVRERFPLSAAEREQATSVGIPTWAYGHEPPAPFATHIAKYFANSVREDGLLTMARAGVIFAPGNAGTTQEIFQDAAQNQYRTAGYASPMVLWGSRYWTEDRPVWPLLESVAAGQEYGQWVRLLDREEEIFELFETFSNNNLHRTTARQESTS